DRPQDLSPGVADPGSRRRGQWMTSMQAKPCWYLVTTEDRMIPPAARRAMAGRTGASVSAIAASHAVYVSQPQVVADLIKQAAAAAGEGSQALESRLSPGRDSGRLAQKPEHLGIEPLGDRRGGIVVGRERADHGVVGHPGSAVRRFLDEDGDRRV